MKKTVLKSILAGFSAISFLFGFASCADGSGGSGGSSSGSGSSSSVTSNTALYRLNATDGCDFADDGTLTDFGSDGSYLYYPVALDLDSDSAELSATVYVSAATGKMGVGLIDIASSAVDRYAIATTAQSIRYLDGVTKTADSGSSWDSSTLAANSSNKNTLCTTGVEYLFKVSVANKKLSFAVYSADGNTVIASKLDKGYTSFLTPNGKVYLAIGSISGSTSYITYSNIKVSINGGTTYTIDTISDIPDQTDLSLEETSKEIGKGEEGSVTYTATDSNGNSVVPEVSSSDESVATVSVDSDNSQIVISAVSAGSATITVKNDTKTAVISVVVTAFNSSDPYDLVAVYPVNGASSAYEDGEFMLTFDSTPVLNEGGSIKIYDSDGNIADSIAFADETQTLFSVEFGVEDQLARVEGSSVYFTPHVGKIENGKTYYVAISDGAISGTMNGSDFTGLTNNESNSKWKFTTRAKPSVSSTITVDGSQSSTADFRTIQGALNAIGSSSGDYKITVAKGTYRELLYFKGSANVEIEGQTTTTYGKDVEVRFANAGTMNSDKNNDEKKRCLFEFIGGNLILENIYFNNTFLRSNKIWTTTGNTQAEALGFDSGKAYWVAAYNCGFYSHQDTIRTIGKAWFYGCYITGDVDFIWQEGNGLVQLVEKSQIVALGDDTTKAYLVAPGASQVSPVGKGSVILNSTVDVQCKETYFGRTPWSSGRYNNAAIVNTAFTTSGSGVLNSKFYNASCTDSIDDKYVGWKTYGNTGVTEDTTYHVALTEDFYNQEYSGRRTILNRVYTSDDGKFVQDTSYNWDVDSLITEQNWNVDTDSSSELASGENAVESVTYSLASSTLPSGLTNNGFTYHSSGSWYASTGSTISFDVTGNCLITVTGFYSGSGTIVAGSQSAGTFYVASGNTSETLSSKYLNYSGATTVTLTVSAQCYLTEIKVVYLDEITQVSSITLSETTATLTAGETLTLTATVSPDDASFSELAWSSSDTSKATVSNGVVKTLASGNVTITAKAQDGSGKSAECSIIIEDNESAGIAVNNVYTYTLQGLSSGTSITSAEDVSLSMALSDGSFNSGYGYYGSSWTAEIPVMTDSTIIAYVTYTNGTNASLELYDGTESLGTRTIAAKSDTKEATGPIACIWHYSGTSDNLTLKAGSVQIYVGKIIVDTTPIPSTLTQTTYDFTDSASFATPLAGTSGDCKAIWYSTVTGSFKDSKYGLQAAGNVYMVLKVGGASTVKVNVSYEQGSGAITLYDIDGETVDSVTLDADNGVHERDVNISEAGIYTLYLPKNTYVSSIVVE